MFFDSIQKTLIIMVKDSMPRLLLSPMPGAVGDATGSLKTY